MQPFLPPSLRSLPTPVPQLHCPISSIHCVSTISLTDLHPSLNPTIVLSTASAASLHLFLLFLPPFLFGISLSVYSVNVNIPSICIYLPLFNVLSIPSNLYCSTRSLAPLLNVSLSLPSFYILILLIISPF